MFEKIEKPCRLIIDGAEIKCIVKDFHICYDMGKIFINLESSAIDDIMILGSGDDPRKEESIKNITDSQKEILDSIEIVINQTKDDINYGLGYIDDCGDNIMTPSKLGTKTIVDFVNTVHDLNVEWEDLLYLLKVCGIINDGQINLSKLERTNRKNKEVAELFAKMQEEENAEDEDIDYDDYDEEYDPLYGEDSEWNWEPAWPNPVEEDSKYDHFDLSDLQIATSKKKYDTRRHAGYYARKYVYLDYYKMDIDPENLISLPGDQQPGTEVNSKGKFYRILK